MLGRNLTRRTHAGLWIAALAVIAALGVLVRPAEREKEGRASVADGDTLRLQGVAIRLKGIDAPELHQTCSLDGRPYRCGETSREALAERVAGRPVACRIEGRDRYGRSLARCEV